MPELPDLEVLKEKLEERFLEKKVEEVEVINSKALRTKYFQPRVLKRGILKEIERKGKSLLFHFHSGFKLVFQPLLRGWISLDPEPNVDQLMKLKFEGTELHFIEFEKRGLAGLFIVRKPEGLSFLKNLGVDPLSPDFKLEKFKELLRERKDNLKKFLLDQKAVCGIGNAYADEILWEARLSPFRKCGKLDESEMQKLFSSITKVLQEAIKVIREKAGDGLPPFEFREHLKVHRREGSPCPRCGAKIKAVWEGDRGTFYCPECQK